MEKLVQKNKYYVFIYILLIITSCNENSIFTEYKTLDKSNWLSNTSLEFNFTIQDTINPKNLFIHIRNDNNYEFANLFLITTLHFPDKTKVIDTLEYKMANEKGEFIGSGPSYNIENKLFYKENKIFLNKGKHRFSVKQAMRKNDEVAPIKSLKGVKNVGFTIEKIK